NYCPLYHLISERQQRRRNRDPERLCRLEIDAPVHPGCTRSGLDRDFPTYSIMPSPVVFTMRPRCSLILGSTRSRRWAFNWASVPSSSAPMSRLYPATSAARIAVSRRSMCPSAKNTSSGYVGGHFILVPNRRHGVVIAPAQAANRLRVA